jgi:uncharacterized membrane protein (UPF0127 family)
VIISNLSRGTVVASEADEARSFTAKLFGLMGKAGMADDAALIIYHTNWIHTFWMRFPLDLIYISREAIVVGLEPELAPNRIGKPFWRAQTVIELRAGAIAASRTQVGDSLQIVPAARV